MIGIATLTALVRMIFPPFWEENGGASERPTSPESPMDEFITIATYDKVTDAHIALGRLSAEGIEAQLFDEHAIQMDWLYFSALGGIKLRVPRDDEKAARAVLETDYSKVLEEADLGSRED